MESLYTGLESKIWTEFANNKGMVKGDGGYVYLIYNPDNKRYKIGQTIKYHDRIMNLVNSSGSFLESVLVIHLDTIDESRYDIESFLHEYFNDKRVVGEWFSLDNDDVYEIMDLFYCIEGESILDNTEELGYNMFHDTFLCHLF
jgi:hypothetical protein